MKQLILLLLTAFALTHVRAQQAQITSTVTPEIEVCGGNVAMGFKVINTNGTALTNPLFRVSLPPGIEYVAQSLSESTNQGVAEQNVAQDTALLFQMNALPAGDSAIFTLLVEAKMAAIDYQDIGGVFRNDVTFTYTSGSDNHQSDSYNILYPAFSILSVTPNAQTIVSGTSTQRSITIINGGNGKI
ncbi:MAG: hypothetical protein AAF570_24830, partial [Bacteroidota bacterium]